MALPRCDTWPHAVKTPIRDDECAKKYKKAADEIRKKTHEEYLQDIKNLIKDVMNNVK